MFKFLNSNSLMEYKISDDFKKNRVSANMHPAFTTDSKSLEQQINSYSVCFFKEEPSEILKSACWFTKILEVIDLHFPLEFVLQLLKYIKIYDEFDISTICFRLLYAIISKLPGSLDFPLDSFVLDFFYSNFPSHQSVKLLRLYLFYSSNRQIINSEFINKMYQICKISDSEAFDRLTKLSSVIVQRIGDGYEKDFINILNILIENYNKVDTNHLMELILNCIKSNIHYLYYFIDRNILNKCFYLCINDIILQKLLLRVIEAIVQYNEFDKYLIKNGLLVFFNNLMNYPESKRFLNSLVIFDKMILQNLELMEDKDVFDSFLNVLYIFDKANFINQSKIIKIITSYYINANEFIFSILNQNEIYKFLFDYPQFTECSLIEKSIYRILLVSDENLKNNIMSYSFDNQSFLEWLDENKTSILVNLTNKN